MDISHDMLIVLLSTSNSPAWRNTARVVHGLTGSALIKPKLLADESLNI